MNFVVVGFISLNELDREMTNAYIFRAIRRPVIDAIAVCRNARSGTFDPEWPAYAEVGEIRLVVGRGVLVPYGKGVYSHAESCERVDFFVAAVGGGSRLDVQKQICELFGTRIDGVEFVGHYANGRLLTERGLD